MDTAEVGSNEFVMQPAKNAPSSANTRANAPTNKP